MTGSFRCNSLPASRGAAVFLLRARDGRFPVFGVADRRRSRKQIGVALLVRTTRAVTLTEAGSDYLSRIEPILTALEEADHAARGTGELRGSCASPRPPASQYVASCRVWHVSPISTPVCVWNSSSMMIGKI